MRFAAPRPPESWQGTRDATRFAEPALQPTVVARGRMDEQALLGSEDCLYLNVYAPLDPGRYPVMLWIHGGGGVVGSPNDCDGTRFARAGVVVVTIAHRLGALGLLHLPGVLEGEPGCNFALLDQIAALQWVKDNIAAFGGDPERVTVAGLSNGGRTVGNILAAPASHGLYRQAVVMSGTGVGYLVAEPNDAERVTALVLGELGLEVSHMVKLREIPAETIVAAQTRVFRSSPILIPYQVVVDGVIVPRRPIDAIAAGSAEDVRLLIGTTHDEWDAFAIAKATSARGTSMVVGVEELERAQSAYRRLLPPDWSDEEVRTHTLTSSEYWLPATRFAEAHVRAGGCAWMYRLDWRLAERGEGPGALHGLDAPLMSPPTPAFDAVLEMATRDLAGLDAVMDDMHAALVRFCSSGDPGENWPTYELTNRATYLFDDPSALAQDPDSELRLVWEELIPPVAR